MTPLLQRSSLVAEVMKTLRAAIVAGEWRETLPGELDLCRQLQISRVTLRAALGGLERVGLIEGGQGKRRRIKAGPETQPQPSRSREILMLSPQPMHRLGSTTLFWLDSLRQGLADAGYKFEVAVNSAVYATKPKRRLERWLAETNPAGLLLYRTTPAMQDWFANCGCPAVIAGSRHEDVKLPAVDIDYAATCRHAVGQLRAHGHDHLAFLLPRSGLAGDLESERGFREGLEQTRNPKAVGHIAHHDGTRGSVVAALAEVQAKSPRPTGYLVAHAPHALTGVGFLVRQGAHFRGDVALISRDDDPILEHVVPSVARYSMESGYFARQVCKVMLQAISRAGAPPEDRRLITRFVAGETLG